MQEDDLHPSCKAQIGRRSNATPLMGVNSNGWPGTWTVVKDPWDLMDGVTASFLIFCSSSFSFWLSAISCLIWAKVSDWLPPADNWLCDTARVGRRSNCKGIGICSFTLFQLFLRGFESEAWSLEGILEAQCWSSIGISPDLERRGLPAFPESFIVPFDLQAVERNLTSKSQGLGLRLEWYAQEDIWLDSPPCSCASSSFFFSSKPSR